MRRRTVIESKNIREVTDSITGNSYLGKIGKKFRSEKHQGQFRRYRCISVI